MVTPSRVSRWAPTVQAELDAQSIPLPNELILSVIKVESSGNPGLINPISGASGLMQIMPITLTDFNARHGTNYTMDDMQSGSDNAAKKQIRVGIGVIAHYWRQAFKYLSKRSGDIPINDVAHIADLFYVAGPGATKKRLDKLANPTWIGVQSAYPAWNALPHPRKVFKNPIPWDLDIIRPWLEGPSHRQGTLSTDPKKGFAIGIMMLLVAYWLMKGKNK